MDPIIPHPLSVFLIDKADYNVKVNKKTSPYWSSLIKLSQTQTLVHHLLLNVGIISSPQPPHQHTITTIKNENTHQKLNKYVLFF